MVRVCTIKQRGFILLTLPGESGASLNCAIDPVFGSAIIPDRFAPFAPRYPKSRYEVMILRDGPVGVKFCVWAWNEFFVENSSSEWCNLTVVLFCAWGKALRGLKNEV